jgi:hypothetical protein
MNEYTILYEVMLELAEEENEDLRVEIDYMHGYIQYLHDKNKELVEEYNNLLLVERRLN